MVKYIILDGKPTLNLGSIKCKRSAICVELEEIEKGSCFTVHNLDLLYIAVLLICFRDLVL